MKPILLIVGETSCGKDTFAAISKEMGKKPVCSYATRPMRPNEQEGREHKFISPKQASKILCEKKDHVVAYTKIGVIEYFALDEDVKEADMYIIDPNGVKYLESHFPDIPTYTVYITAPEEVRRERAGKRGDLPEVLDKRIKDESEQFSTFHDYDVCYNNTGTLEDLKAFTEKTWNIILEMEQAERDNIHDEERDS